MAKEKIVIFHHDERGVAVHWSEVGDLVRCKDCKYHEDEELGMVYCPNIVGGWVSEDFFCADGERREPDE